MIKQIDSKGIFPIKLIPKRKGTTFPQVYKNGSGFCRNCKILYLNPHIEYCKECGRKLARKPRKAKFKKNGKMNK